MDGGRHHGLTLEGCSGCCLDTLGGAASFREVVPSAKLFVHWLAAAAPRPRRFFLACAVLRNHSTLCKGVCSTQRQRFLCCALAHSVLFKSSKANLVRQSYTLHIVAVSEFEASAEESSRAESAKRVC